MRLPALIVNFKAYREGSGRNALQLAEICEKFSDKESFEIIVAPQFSDIRPIKSKYDVKVFSQHLDPVSYGSHTGHVLPENLKDAGVSGTLINHSEKRIPQEKIDKILERCSELDMDSVVCVRDLKEAEEIAELGPDFIAYEPPELIGGDVSVSRSKPEIVKRAVERIKSVDKSIEILTGAGIKNKEDVEKAIELGTKGVLVASGIVKAEKPYEAIEDIVDGF